MDSRAFHGKDRKRSHFIVSHVFTERIYDKHLVTETSENGNAASIDGELGDSSATLYTCFYELELLNTEVSKCAQKWQPEGDASPELDLGSLDVWRLMALHEDETETLTEFIVPTKELLQEARRNWEPTPETQGLIAKTAEAQRLDLASEPASGGVLDVPQYAILGSLGGGLGALRNLITKHLPGLAGQVLGSVSCLAIGWTSSDAAKQIVGATLQALNPMLGATALPVNLGLGMITGIAQAVPRLLGAKSLALDHCGQTAAKAIAEKEQGRSASENAPSQSTTVTVATEKAPLILQAAEAIETNDAPKLVDTLKQSDELAIAVSQELERSSGAVRSVETSSQIGSTLSDRYQELTFENTNQIKNKLQSFSARLGRDRSLAYCPAPKVFVRQVLRPALIATGKMTNSGVFLDENSGCGGAKEQSTNQGDAISDEPKAEEIAVQDRTLGETIIGLQETINDANARLKEICSSNPEQCNVTM